MPENPSPSPIHTFIIRIWAEWSISEPVFRGYILHLQSGQKNWFQESASFAQQIITYVDHFASQENNAHSDASAPSAK